MGAEAPRWLAVDRVADALAGDAVTGNCKDVVTDSLVTADPHVGFKLARSIVFDLLVTPLNIDSVQFEHGVLLK